MRRLLPRFKRARPLRLRQEQLPSPGKRKYMVRAPGAMPAHTNSLPFDSTTPKPNSNSDLRHGNVTIKQRTDSRVDKMRLQHQRRGMLRRRPRRDRVLGRPDHLQRELEQCARVRGRQEEGAEGLLQRGFEMALAGALLGVSLLEIGLGIQVRRAQRTAYARGFAHVDFEVDFVGDLVAPLHL